MWFKDEVVYPRFVKSFVCSVIIQFCYVSIFIFLLKLISWHPLLEFFDWLYYLFHWKTLAYQAVLCITTVAFGALNMRFFAVEKSISCTRFEKICKILSPHSLQHVFSTITLGGIATYCCAGLLSNFFQENVSLLASCLKLETDFEHYFVIGHGCYTGIMFSLKYFICSLYLIKFPLNQERKVTYIKCQISNLLKESFTCILKALHWYCAIFLIFSPVLNKIFSAFFGIQFNMGESILYNMLNPRLFVISIITGVIISMNWSLYLCIFNLFTSERYIFPIEVPVKSDKSRILSKALTCKDFNLLQYLAVLDLRLLSQHDFERRQQIFAISHPGGHPHQWNAISEICISSLQKFVYSLQEYSMTLASIESKLSPPKGTLMHEQLKSTGISDKKLPAIPEKVFKCLRERPTIAYFFDELPNTKLMRLFVSSQPLVWMIEALGYLVCAAYKEDKFGVVQQSLPRLICLLLDVKMAEEKMPVRLIGIRTYVKDPQGRYEHIHQRLCLKTTVNSVLCRIAATYKNDIEGIYLPEEYRKYFQRYLDRKNA